MKFGLAASPISRRQHPPRFWASADAPPPHQPDGTPPTAVRSYPPFAAAAATIDREGIAAAADAALARWFTPESVARDEPAVRYARSCLTPAAAPSLAAAFRLVAKFDIGDRLSALEAPARFIAANATPSLPRRSCGRRLGGRSTASSSSNPARDTCSPWRVPSAWRASNGEPESRRSAPLGEPGERLLARVEDREVAPQARDLERAQQAVRRAHEHHACAAEREVPQCVHQDADAGRVHEGHVREVHDHPGLPLLGEAEQPAPEAGWRVCVDLTRKRDDVPPRAHGLVDQPQLGHPSHRRRGTVSPKMVSRHRRARLSYP